ncbi:MAG: Xaa-Pro peptidase family protein [Gemmatimonadaceae bacterium]
MFRTRTLRTVATTCLLLPLCGLSRPAPAQAPPSLREAAAARRAAYLQRIPEGVAIIQSADRSQPNLYEHMVPDTENHDFIYFTGLEGAAPPGDVLVLNPKGERFREILYTSGDVEAVRRATGIAHVFPHARFLEDLSSALTDYRNLRITQLRFKPVASELSQSLGDTHKVIWYNYPRFTNLGEPANPRLDLPARLRAVSGEVEVRDASDGIDRLRMIHDAFGLASLRRAIAITGHGLMEAMRTARPGMTTREVGEMMDFVYRYNGAGLGFPTGVSAGRAETQRFETAREEMEARAAELPIRNGDLIHIDTGAEWNHYSADIQRVVPAGDTFTPEQKRFYDAVLAVQKAVIAKVRPGVRWSELQELAVQMLRDAGGLDSSYTYGIGHFIGMEVHDHGYYTEPLQPGMVISIEQGAVRNGVRVAFEDDVLVTADGREWLTRFIPIETEEVERLRREPRIIADPSRLKAEEAARR